MKANVMISFSYATINMKVNNIEALNCNSIGLKNLQSIMNSESLPNMADISRGHFNYI